VKVPRTYRVVTAALLSANRNREQRALLASRRMRNKVNRLGEVALETASDYRLESLLAAGHEFAEGLGLMTRAIQTLVAVSLSKGAVGASQNMIGNAMHAVVAAEDVEKVTLALRFASRAAVVESYGIGGKRAKVLKEEGINR
jgi:pantoate kinase